MMLERVIVDAPQFDVKRRICTGYAVPTTRPAEDVWPPMPMFELHGTESSWWGHWGESWGSFSDNRQRDGRYWIHEIKESELWVPQNEIRTIVHILVGSVARKDCFQTSAQFPRSFIIHSVSTLICIHNSNDHICRMSNSKDFAKDTISRPAHKAIL